MRVLGVPNTGTASDHHRVIWPLQAMHDAGLAETVITPRGENLYHGPTYDIRVGPMTNKIAEQLAAEYVLFPPADVQAYIDYVATLPDASTFDVVVMTRRADLNSGQAILALQASGVKVVMDLDDDFLSMPRDNENYVYVGIDGEHVLEWFKMKNLKPPFDVSNPALAVWNAAAFTRDWRNGYVAITRQVDMLTVTTEKLRRVFGGFNAKTRILPNQINYGEWEFVESRLYGQPTFGWAGSQTHFSDLLEVQFAIQKVLDAVPNSIFVVIGFPQVLTYLKNIDQSRVKAFNWMPINEYRSFVAGLDVIWSPSHLSPFNEAKSDIRVMEAWLAGSPVVASETTYGPTVREADGGFVARNPGEWARHTIRLLQDADLRAKLTVNGFNYVVNHRLYSENAGLWASAYEELCSLRQESLIA